MFRNTSKRSRAPNKTGLSDLLKPKGHFKDGTWYCSCEPQPLPAERFRVKKPGKNQGRWFYTCQQSSSSTTPSNLHIPVPRQPKSCGFFLWDEDAKPREERVVLSNSRSEPLPRKRSAAEALLDDDERAEDGSWLLTGQEEDDLVAFADAISRDAPVTPSRTRLQSNGLPTPVTNGRATENWSEAQTPTPNRHRDALLTPSTINTVREPDSGQELGREVLDVLSGDGIALQPETRSRLDGLFARHELRVKGILRGRDITRVGLRANEVRVTELVARIAALEAERETDRSLIRRLRSANPQIGSVSESETKSQTQI